MKTVTIRFKNGVPVSNAKDPRTREAAEAFGAAFLAAAKEGPDTLHVTARNPDLPDEAKGAALAVLRRFGRAAQ